MSDAVTHLLATDDAAIAARWAGLETWVRDRFGREPSIETILFLIGIQSRGRGYEPALDKDRKEALVMEGSYCVFAAIGLYEPMGIEADGSLIWERQADLPAGLSIEQQEKLLHLAILRYFDDLLDDVPF